MQITRLVTFLLVCISYAHYSSGSGNESNTDVVEGIIYIPREEDAIVLVTDTSKSIIQNIGKVAVKITDLIEVEPGTRKTFGVMTKVASNNRLELFNNNDKRAILYISYLKRQFIETPPTYYDNNKVLKKASTLGVKYIPKKNVTLNTLISYFWPKDEDNVWKQIFDVIKYLLDPEDQPNIYKYIISDMELLKIQIEDLNYMTYNYDTRTSSSYLQIADNLNEHEHFFKSIKSKVLDEVLLKLYILPLYSNIITLKMYFYVLAAADPATFNFNSDTFDIRYPAWHTLYNKTSGAVNYIYALQEQLSDKLYEIVYAGGLYNVMMNAYTHLALHGLDMLYIWRQLYHKIAGQGNSDYCNIDRHRAISYSNLYGRATPDLLRQAIIIQESTLAGYYSQNRFEAAELCSIYFNIIDGIVCGLRLYFLPNFLTFMGTYDEFDIFVAKLVLSNNMKIIGLDVYKNKFIRCLNFTMLGNQTTSRLFGDDCSNSEHTKFQLKDHYINSVYLANDYPDTGIYFDNIAVSYLPNPVKVF